MSETLPVTDRTRLRRKPARGSHELGVIHAILDEALVCHVAIASPENLSSDSISGGPRVLPTAFVRVDDALYLHGSAANGMFRAIAAGAEVAIAVTLLDGLVLARTAFHHSVNYRSVVIFGRGAQVHDLAVQRRALAALVDRMVPGRAEACRPPSDRELAATIVVAIPIDEASAKIRSGPPVPDDGEDAALPYWAGVIPLATVREAPIAAPDCAVAGP
ncbi:MAG: pyridoxamine 5'-phosphate oxidase family protein [Deltaproteobacteria bacterium]|nr:pyridoxamine 5'-phosphate oxidase family protein [Deltaproteobacteria bacterium]